MKRDQAADRQAFEQFMLQRNACTRLARQSASVGGQYRTVTVQRAWELWQAACVHADNCAAALDPVTPEPSTPWYPDDSGEWVEVPEDLEEMPKELNPGQQIHVLLEKERGRKQNNVEKRYPSHARMYAWDRSCGEAFRIVAYKVVKP